MPVLAAVFKTLFASSLLSSSLLTSGKRLKQQEAGKLIQGQTTRGSPPLLPRGSDSSGGGSPGRNSYGLKGIGRAMASVDEAAAAAVAEGALGKQRYESLRQPGGTTNAAMASRNDVPERSSPQKSGDISPMPSPTELTEVFGSMDTNDNGALNLQELQDGMDKFGSPLPQAELEKLFMTADRNRDGKIDAPEFAAAVQATAAMSSERVGEHPPEIVKQSELVRDTFQQESENLIDSLIAQDIQEYKTRVPKWAAFMQKLQHEGIKDYGASEVFVALYKHCGTSENIRSGVHQQCILDKLRPLIGQAGEQTFSVGKTFLQIFVQMMFPQLERQIQALVETL